MAPGAEPVLPAPGLTEVIETVRRRGNTSSPQQIASAISVRGVRIELPIDVDLIRAAELIERSKKHLGPSKATNTPPSTLSLADALILAIVERLQVKVVTYDGYWSIFAEAHHTTAQVISMR